MFRGFRVHNGKKNTTAASKNHITWKRPWNVKWQLGLGLEGDHMGVSLNSW